MVRAREGGKGNLDFIEAKATNVHDADSEIREGIKEFAHKSTTFLEDLIGKGRREMSI